MKSTPTADRFSSLDIFRGMTICFMIIVNTPGNEATTFWPLLHAHWNGFTPTDLVFPSFLFAVGNALSFVSKKWENMSQSEVLWKIGKRTALIFLIGYLMYWFPFFKLDGQLNIISYPMSQTRIMGVLQRIALCYGIVAVLVYYFGQTKTIWIGIVSLLAYWMLCLAFGLRGAEFTFTEMPECDWICGCLVRIICIMAKVFRLNRKGFKHATCTFQCDWRVRGRQLFAKKRKKLRGTD